MVDRIIKLILFGCVLIIVIGVGLLSIPSIEVVVAAINGKPGEAIDGLAKSGDFIGGWLGAFLSLLSVVVLVLSFRQQTEANQLVSFESKFFEMLRMHRDNVREISVADEFGRKVFVLMIREFREILAVLRIVCRDTNVKLNPVETFSLGYVVFYYGTGPNSTRMMKCAMASCVQGFTNPIDDVELAKLLNVIVMRLESDKGRFKRSNRLGYTPFEGHQSRLGHYFRHIYHMVIYVHEQKIEGVRGVDDKLKYLKSLRAQLSNHEQAMLLIASLSPLGKKWIDYQGCNFLEQYMLVHNIPRYFFKPSCRTDSGLGFDRDQISGSNCGSDDGEIDLDSSQIQWLKEGYFDWEANG